MRTAVAPVIACEAAVFEAALTDFLRAVPKPGMKIGETKTVHLTPDLAYGEYNDQLIQEFDKSIFGDADLGTFNPGDTVYLRSANGIFPVKIYSIGNNSVFLDLNHRLAGKNLNFEITVDSVN